MAAVSAQAAQPGSLAETPINQIALGVTDGSHTVSWYQRLFGFEATVLGAKRPGESAPVPLAARMLGIPVLEVNSVSTLTGADPMSQFEVIELSRPPPGPLPADFGPRYAGYGVVGLVVADFAGLQQRLRADGVEYVTTGAPGRQSLWFRDPDGVPLEIMQRDPLGLRPADKCGNRVAAIRSLTLTVADFAKARRFWTAAVGLSEERPEAFDFNFNAFPAKIAGGAQHWEQVVLKGDTLLIRLLTPRGIAIIPRPAARHLSGVYHIATIAGDKSVWTARVEHVRAMGYPLLAPQSAMFMGEEAGTIYGHDDQGNIAEFGFVLPGHERKFGWIPGPVGK